MALTSYYVMIPYTLILLNVLVIAHELGHFLAARRFGVSTPEFSVGFGPLLGKIVKNNVQYSLRAIPLGGYVKITGMSIALEGEESEEEKNVPPNRRFDSLPLWKKLVVIIAGPLNNLILAFLSLVLIAAVVGVPYTYKVDRPIIESIEFKSPAYEAGLMRGDEVVAINRKQIKTWEELANIVNRSAGKPLDFLIQRDNKSFVVTIKPFYDPRFKVGRIGISPPLVLKKYPLNKAVVIGVSQGLDSFKAIVEVLLRLLVGKERPTGVGPIGMVGMIKQAADTSLFQFLFVIPMLNLFLGLFNLLPVPLPLLDGGWISILFLERLRRREFSPEQKAAAQMIGMGLLLLLFVLITYGDIMSQFKHLVNLRNNK